MSDSPFCGFGGAAQRFLFELSANNRKEWWDANVDRYRAEIRDPALAFIDALGERLARRHPELNFSTKTNGSGSLMRPYRDVRFSPDKRPYKEQVGIVFWLGTGRKVELPCFYFHIGIDEAFFFAGQYMMPRPVLERYREAVASDAGGARLDAILNQLGDDYSVIPDPEYKRVPRGFAADHARVEHLRRKGIGVSRAVSPADLASSALIDACDRWAADAAPLLEWLMPLNVAG